MSAAAIALAVSAYTLLSVGLVLMRKGIAWIGWRGPRGAAFRGALAAWTAGFVLSNLYIVPSAMALRSLPSHVVGAFAGWGVVVMVALSGAALGERLAPADAAWTGMIVAGIAILGWSGRGPDAAVGRGAAAAAGPYAVMAAVPVAAAAIAVASRLRGTARARVFGAVSGISTGMIVLSMKVLVGVYGYRVAAYLRSPYFYAYLAFSLGAFVALQVAYKSGGMMSVGPVQYSASIVYPAIGTAAVFGGAVGPVAVAAIGVIVAGVAAMLRRPRSVPELGAGRAAAAGTGAAP